MNKVKETSNVEGIFQVEEERVMLMVWEDMMIHGG